MQIHRGHHSIGNSTLQAWSKRKGSGSPGMVGALHSFCVRQVPVSISHIAPGGRAPDLHRRF
eukprot:3256033-Lingulodinium_polyedra.AAC.1